MILDLHCHTKYSRDNTLEPEDLIFRAVQRGLDGVCITEHYSVDASKPVEDIKIPGGFLVLRGVEISTDCGHLLAYGLADDSWNEWGRETYLNLGEVIRVVHDRGGVCAPAHPFRGWESLGERIFHTPGLDAVETHNGGAYSEQNQQAIKAAVKLGLPSIGGSDCHQANQVGRSVTEFFEPIHNIDELVKAIIDGKCRGRSNGLDAARPIERSAESAPHRVWPFKK